MFAENWLTQEENKGEFPSSEIGPSSVEGFTPRKKNLRDGMKVGNKNRNCALSECGAL